MAVAPSRREILERCSEEREWPDVAAGGVELAEQGGIAGSERFCLGRVRRVYPAAVPARVMCRESRTREI
jgi:hypothetical protein